MKHGNGVNAALWILQIALAGLFLFGGAFKLTLPAEALTAETGLPADFMQFISLAEVAGGWACSSPASCASAASSHPSRRRG